MVLLVGSRRRAARCLRSATVGYDGSTAGRWARPSRPGRGRAWNRWCNHRETVPHSSVNRPRIDDSGWVWGPPTCPGDTRRPAPSLGVSRTCRAARGPSRCEVPCLQLGAAGPDTVMERTIPAPTARRSAPRRRAAAAGSRSPRRSSRPAAPGGPRRRRRSRGGRGPPPPHRRSAPTARPRRRPLPAPTSHGRRSSRSHRVADQHRVAYVRSGAAAGWRRAGAWRGRRAAGGPCSRASARARARASRAASAPATTGAAGSRGGVRRHCRAAPGPVVAVSHAPVSPRAPAPAPRRAPVGRRRPPPR